MHKGRNLVKVAFFILGLYRGRAAVNSHEQDQPKKYLSTTEAAKRMGVSKSAVRELCNDGQLPGAEKKRGRWRIPVEANEKEETKVFSGGSPPNTRFWRWIVAAGIVVALIAGVVQISGIDLKEMWSYVVPAPLAFEPATDDEILIVIATFHETAATKTEPHAKIRRAIEETAAEVGLDTLRVEEEPTILKADEREAAEALGNRYNASIVIWGEDTGVEVIVNFLNLKQPYSFAPEVKILERERVQLINPDAYALFIVSDLPGQLTFLSLYALGQSFAFEKDYGRALSVIEQAVTSLAAYTNIQGLETAYAWIGWLYLEPFADNEQAIVNFSKAIEIDSEYVYAYKRRANAYARQDKFDKAIADSDKAIELDPENSDAYINRGFIYHRQGAYDKAIADFDKAIELDPANSDVYISRGFFYHKRGIYDKAIADYDKAIELDPENSDAYINRGNTFLVLEDYDSAFPSYNKSIEINSKDPWGYLSRGQANLQQGNVDQAIADLTTAINLNPKFSEAYAVLAGAYLVKGNLEEALIKSSEAINLDHTNADAYVFRGAINKSLGNYEQALKDISKAIEIDPNVPESYYNRGQIRRIQGDIEHAIADFEHGLALDEKSSSQRRAQEELESLRAQLETQQSQQSETNQ